MSFKKYYAELLRRQESAPRMDEAREDYRRAMEPHLFGPIAY